VPLDKIAYMLNLDMVGRVRNNILSVGGGGTAGSFAEILKKADENSPLELKTFSKGGFGPSDHMSFALKNIPVLFFWSGSHPDYHRPSDDADKVNYEGIDEVVKLSSEVVDAMRTHEREKYVAVAEHGMMSPGGGPSGGGPGGSRVTLGVVPDYGNEVEKGVKISGTVPGSPAEAAGLKAGDVIVQFGKDKIDSLYGLTDALKSGKVGQKVKLGVIRDGKTIELEATLAERKG
jgi:membrane-associated protease RseP (regulator of RpoE activity)